MPGFKILVPLVNIFKLSILSVNGIPVNNQLAVNPLTIDPENDEEKIEGPVQFQPVGHAASHACCVE